MNRNNSLDLLRVISCFLVVVLHVASDFVLDNTDIYNFQFTIGNFYDSFTRVSVPVFVLLSGAFLLDNPNNKNFQLFYEKSFKKIGIPTLVWSFIYVIYRYIVGIGALKLINRPFDFWEPIWHWIIGGPFYHMWYLYMIVGLYLLTPLIIRLKEEIQEKTFFSLSIGILIWDLILATCTRMNWLLQFVLYLGYFMLGYSLKNYFLKRKINFWKPLIIYILSSLGIFFITEIFIRYNLFGKSFYFYGYLSPLVAIGSLSLFSTFLNLDLKANSWTTLSVYTFNIYILHAGIIYSLNIILDIFNLKFNGLWYIPLTSIFVFVLSYLLSFGINLGLQKLKK